MSEYRKHYQGICLDCKAMIHSRDDWETGTCGIDGRKINHINNRIPCYYWVCPRWRHNKNPLDEADEYEWGELGSRDDLFDDMGDYADEYEYSLPLAESKFENYFCRENQWARAKDLMTS